ncbi:hypothetical protein QH639_18185 [Lysinibacillus sp. 1 U-2021]|uniref:hypothetical protein n=1 Tax=Lysinibacillus sp. 1 U-2021 TaxID=3039426 RepID=UPI002480CF07|nr:hypothetical protein [Lysinibacillus sp. 1 U-2021]WGT37749.1 hypothetical protein QH639_18185 [Lysinibacillus sp. 1 U-2021]
MNQITPEALEFLEEAKKGFDNVDTITYINKNKNYIALRSGFREDCLSIYELGNEVGLFTEQLPKQYTVIVDYDELEKLKKYKNTVENIKSVLSFYENSLNEHNVKEVLISVGMQLK